MQRFPIRYLLYFFYKKKSRWKKISEEKEEIAFRFSFSNQIRSKRETSLKSIILNSKERIYSRIPAFPHSCISLIKLILYTAYCKSMTLTAGIIRSAWVDFVHPMCPCLGGIMFCGAPEHNCKIIKVPADIVVKYAA